MCEESYRQTAMMHEHDALRSELLQNRKYVFERPLLIITAAAVAAGQLSGKPSVLFLPFLLIVVLIINLWFTVNRLKSTARIAAYIDAVLEGAPYAWIGWEKSLREHRMWMKKHGLEDRRKLLSKHTEKDAVPDAMTYYRPLLLLHVVTVVVALAASLLALGTLTQIPQLVSFAATLGAAIVLACCCLGPYRPSRMRDLIEIQRATWISVLDITQILRLDAPSSECETE